jgi:predicted neuraminidase
MYTTMVFSGNSDFPTSHAGSICELPNGELLVAWYAGSREGAPDSVILGSRLRVGSREWQPPAVWVNVAGHAAGNPRVFVGPDKALWLISPINYGRWCDGGTRMFLKRSYDLGETWTDLEIFTTRRRILGKNKPIYIARSRVWILPVEYEGTGDVAFMRSVDHGKHWKVIARPGAGAYLDQPTVVELSDGTVLAYMRSWEGNIYESRSNDDGLNWSVPTQTALPNPNSGIDMVRLQSGALVLALNPVALGPHGDLTVQHAATGVRAQTQKSEREVRKAANSELLRVIDQRQPAATEYSGGYLAWGPRTPLSLAVSGDEGRRWKISQVLESEEGEFSYPAIIQGTNGDVHILYTYKRTGMKYGRIDVSELH